MVEVESMTPGPEKPSGRPWVKPLLLGVALIAILVAAKAFGLGARLDDLRTWILELVLRVPTDSAIVDAGPMNDRKRIVICLDGTWQILAY